jgi:hypothetical protein
LLASNEIIIIGDNRKTMLADSTPFGLDATWWTALGTLVALLIAIGSVLWGALMKRLARPKLSILFQRVAVFSSTIGNRYWLRVPIANAEGKDEAKNVEIFLQGFATISNEGNAPIEGSVPMRLLWCHNNQPFCASIPAGGFRLLGLGFLEIDGVLREGGQANVIDFPSFTLGGEVAIPAHAQVPLAAQSYLLTTTISADGVPTLEHKIRVVIRRRGNPPVVIEEA